VSDLPIVVTPDGTERKLGFNPDQKKKPVSFHTKVKKVEIPDFPDSELVPYDLAENKSFTYRVKDQFAEGACTGFGLASTMERALWQAGYGNHILSPWFLYAIACNGIDRGSYLDKVCDIATKTGTCLDRYVPPRTINPRVLTAAAREDAKNWQVELSVALPETFKQLRDCANARYPLYHSIHADSGLNTLDRDGVPNNRPGIHNHAIASGFGLKNTRSDGWVIKAPNSWSEKWGHKGFMWLGEGNLAGDFGQFIAIVSLRVKRDLNPPAIAE
jgi:hypothetical protein